MLWQIFTLLHRKNPVENAKSGQKLTFYESIRASQKISQTTNFDNPNYWLFERIFVVRGTSNNQGLAVEWCIYPGSALFAKIKLKQCFQRITMSPQLQIVSHWYMLKSIISRERVLKHNFGQTLKLLSAVVTLNIRWRSSKFISLFSVSKQ